MLDNNRVFLCQFDVLGQHRSPVQIRATHYVEINMCYPCRYKQVYALQFQFNVKRISNFYLFYFNFILQLHAKLFPWVQWILKVLNSTTQTTSINCLRQLLFSPLCVSMKDFEIDRNYAFFFSFALQF